jgi:hypothetical protein
MKDRQGRDAIGLTVRLASRTLAFKVGIGAAAATLCLLFIIGLFVASAPGAAGGEGENCRLSGKAAESIPPTYIPWLQQAASRYRLGPQGFSIVAAIHSVESDFGRSTLPGVRSGTNSAGAAGPGQFLLSTWETYGVDADQDGKRDIYSVPDSVFATANYLRSSGAPTDWRAAIFNYNHAQWYVDEVLEKAASFGTELVCEASPELGEPPAGRLARLDYYARWIESRRIHYCWGGGHSPKPGPSPGSYCWSADGRQVFGAPEAGLDCSGAVRWLLVLAGYRDPGALVSNELGAAYPSGPGEHVTIWANVDHVFVTIDGRDWGTSEANFAHGPGFAGHSKAGFAPSHPPAL